jgi:acetolactate synthase-1/3 small subunit
MTTTADHPKAVIELTVSNHPGVLSHVAGLFSRRAYNLEAVLCAPIPGTDFSRMILLVEGNGRLEQITRQLEKLYDVRKVAVREDLDHQLFDRLEDLIDRRTTNA